MAVIRKRNRSHGIIDKLQPDLKDTVEQMLLSGATYKEIVQYLADNNVTLSQQSVCRYAQKFAATVEMLRTSQDNMAAIMSVIEEYPDLDVTEAIVRIASQNVLQAITAMPEEGWQSLPPDKLLKQANALVRAANYKRRIDTQNRDDTAEALEANKTALFDVLSKRHPTLYRELVRAIEEEKKRTGG